MCEVCHGAPGINQSELSSGLNPLAPELSHAVEDWSDEELFWITKYGIKMSGMPAWGNTHSDNEIWSIIAFVKQMPEMSDEEYKDFSKEVIETKEDHTRYKHKY
jgi:mono/diheme cytochrome c family protein